MPLIEMSEEEAIELGRLCAENEETPEEIFAGPVEMSRTRYLFRGLSILLLTFLLTIVSGAIVAVWLHGKI